MKKYFNIILASALAALTVLSCAKQEQAYEPGTPDPSGCYGVFFPSQDAMGSHTYDPSMEKSVSITVTRTNTSGAITVPFTTTVSDEGVFNFGSITFADGQSETELDVTFPSAPEGKQLSFSVQLDDDNTYISHYNSGAIALDFSVLVVSWQYFLNPLTKEKAVVEFTQNWWGETAWCYIKYYEVDGVRTCQTETFRHFDGKAYNDNAGFWGYGPDHEWTFTWYPKEKDADGNQYIWLHSQFTGWHHSSYDTDVWVYDGWGMDAVYSGKDVGDWLSCIKAGKYPYGYYDGNGGFFLYSQWYYMTGVGGWQVATLDNVGIAEGFTRVDYSLEMVGDYSQEGVTPVYVEAGADVASLKYAVYEGELNSAQMAARFEAIKAGTEATETFDELELDEEEAKKYGAFGIAPETSGTYTLLAVGCDKDGKIQSEGSVVLNHISAADTEKNLVNVSVFTEDTPSRYQELHSYDSFAYYICGKDLTEVHVGLFSEADVEKFGLDYVVEVVKADKAKYGVSADVLKEINADGGYYTVATAMPAKTTVYVVVWATNGALDGHAVDTYTTDPLPYVWKSLGKGQLTDGFFVSLFGKEDITVDCDVFEEETTPGLYMVTGFQLSLAAAFFETDEETMAQYENGNWRNAEVVIDATDPEAVFIEAQDYGVCVNPDAYGFFMIETEDTGKLEDGVFTWPSEEMYVGMPVIQKWYYGNGDGTFSIKLPAAASQSAVPARLSSRKGEVKNYVLSSSASVYNKPVVKYEREVKPVSVKTVKMDNVRQEKDATKGISRPLELI